MKGGTGERLSRFDSDQLIYIYMGRCVVGREKCIAEYSVWVPESRSLYKDEKISGM